MTSVHYTQNNVDTEQSTLLDVLAAPPIKTFTNYIEI